MVLEKITRRTINQVSWDQLGSVFSVCGLWVILLAFLLQLLGYPLGSSLGISPDSRSYLAAAESVAAGGGFYAEVVGRGISGIMVHWPPLYPALLVVFRLVTLGSLIEGAALVNFLAAALLFWQMYRQQVGGVAVLLILLSPAFLTVYGMVWTESLFLVFVAVFLTYATRYWQQPGTQSVRWMILAAMLASLTRYIGVTVIGTGLVLVLARRRYQHLAWFALLSFLPLVVWLGRNYRLTGTLMGARNPSPYTLGDNLVVTIIGLLLMLSPAVMLIILLWHRIRRAPWRVDLLPPLLFAGFYLLFLVGSSTLVHYDPINLRLLSPVLVPVALISAGLLFSIRESA